MFIRKDDTVAILAGDDKGKRGKVLRILREDGKVVVEGINKVYRHLKFILRQGGGVLRQIDRRGNPIVLANAEQAGPTVIDLFSLAADEVRDRFPEVFQWIHDHVKPERDAKGGTPDGAGYAKLWWLFGKPRPQLRAMLGRMMHFDSFTRVE